MVECGGIAKMMMLQSADYYCATVFLLFTVHVTLYFIQFYSISIICFLFALQDIIRYI